jgi:hypothetical protein
MSRFVHVAIDCRRGTTITFWPDDTVFETDSLVFNAFPFPDLAENQVPAPYPGFFPIIDQAQIHGKGDMIVARVIVSSDVVGMIGEDRNAHDRRAVTQSAGEV